MLHTPASYSTELQMPLEHGPPATPSPASNLHQSIPATGSAAATASALAHAAVPVTDAADFQQSLRSRRIMQAQLGKTCQSPSFSAACASNMSVLDTAAAAAAAAFSFDQITGTSPCSSLPAIPKRGSALSPTHPNPEVKLPLTSPTIGPQIKTQPATHTPPSSSFPAQASATAPASAFATAAAAGAGGFRSMSKQNTPNKSKVDHIRSATSPFSQAGLSCKPAAATAGVAVTASVAATTGATATAGAPATAPATTAAVRTASHKDEASFYPKPAASASAPLHATSPRNVGIAGGSRAGPAAPTLLYLLEQLNGQCKVRNRW